VSVQFDRLEQFPQRVEIQESLAYVRQSGYFAAHFQQPLQLPATRLASAAVLILDERIAIFRGNPDTQRSITTQAEAISAVYASEPGGSIAVPTGQVFLRLVEGVLVETQQTIIQQAGYQVSEIVVYAPNAAWLRPRSGDIADALRLLPRLEAIAPREAVEPQMVMGRSKRELEG
jgi:hypothetical protein